MNTTSLFIPIRKVDEANRIVYGVMTAEVVDKSGEIFDYATGKAAIQAWSDEQAEISGGKSKGNVREMHGKIAAGKLTDIAFNDASQLVECAAYVSDEGSWTKVLDGTLTGFSIGGGYANRWADPDQPGVKRYTPKITEVSLVDNPCVGIATFEVVKADGSVEMRKFNSSAQEAQPTMTKATESAAVPAPSQVWQATDGTTHATKREALAKNAELLTASLTKGVDAALAAAEGALNKGDEPAAEETVAGGAAAGEPAADAVADADAALASEVSQATTADDAGAAAPSSEAAPEAPATEAAAAPAAEPATTEKAATTGALKKGLYEVSRFADLLQSLVWFQSCVETEALFEKDGSPLPAELKTHLIALADFLRKLVAEETAELFPSTDDEVIEVVDKGASTGALAKFVGEHAELSKAAGATEFVAKLEKAMNKTAAAHLAAMSDHHGTMKKCMDGIAKCMKALGMGDEGEGEDDANKMAKASGLTDEQLTKLEAFDGLAKKFTEQEGRIGDLVKLVEKIAASPAESKGVVNTAAVVVQKDSTGAPSGHGPVEELTKLINAGASPEQTSLAMMKMALSNPQVVSAA